MLSAVAILSVKDAPRLWQEIVDASADGWIWHTWIAHEFNLCAGKEYGARDLSFFVYDGDKAVGVVPLIVEERGGSLQASYYSGFLPWPVFAGNGTGEGREAFEDFAFAELECKIRKAGATRILMYLTPPQNAGDEESRVLRIATQFGYEMRVTEHHFTEVTVQILSHMQSRYDYKHFSPLFNLTIVKNDKVSHDLEETYFKLHIADSGKQSRSRESYTKQADAVRIGEGFYVVATEKKTGVIAGMSIMNVFKGVAYYGSVAVDPPMRRSCIGYLLQCRAVDEFLARGVRYYDLGPIGTIDPLNPNREASKQELGISLFKAKISGTGSRLVYSLQKTLTQL